MKEIYIDNKDIKASIHEWGNENNPTIICLHGLGSKSLSFIEVAYILKNEYNQSKPDSKRHDILPLTVDLVYPNKVDLALAVEKIQSNTGNFYYWVQDPSAKRGSEGPVHEGGNNETYRINTYIFNCCF